MKLHRIVFTSFALTIAASLSTATHAKTSMKSIGALEIGPGGILFAADPKGAAIYAIEMHPARSNKPGGKLDVAALDKKVAALLGTAADQITINDLAVQPGKPPVAYLSVSRGKGPDAAPALVMIAPDGAMVLFSLADAKSTSVSLDNAPADEVTGQGRRKRNKRMESITDLAFVDGKLAVAGLSNEEFASTLRVIPFPFEEGKASSSGIQIYHGAHGKEETHSPIRTFIPMDIGGEPNIIASYTCTPLVRIPVKQLKPKANVTGTTIAELGNRNKPLDMIEYSSNSKRFILMANSSRGVMKVSTEGIDKVEPIVARVGGGETAGLKYETIEDWKGVVQLAKLGETHALVVKKSEDGSHSLEQLKLP